MDLARENILRRVRSALRVEAHRPTPASSAAIWPAIGDLEKRFQAEFEALRGELVPDLEKFLVAFQRIATDGNDWVPGNAEARDAEVGVTGCECVVAQTGSIVVSGPRAVSVLPPVHLAIARREQLVPDLSAAMALLRGRYGRRWPSALSFITGPSRTADIEKILVLGAHGPKRLALCWV